MRIADFNRRITFQNKDVEVDEIGNHKSIWSDYLTTSSYISFQGKGEEVFLGMEVDRSDISFTVRFQNRLKDINSSDFRILFDDEKYNIISIDFMNYKNRLIKFRCRKVSR
ncbi:MAG: phage head closure protein [Anaerococcus sp.]